MAALHPCEVPPHLASASARRRGFCGPRDPWEAEAETQARNGHSGHFAPGFYSASEPNSRAISRHNSGDASPLQAEQQSLSQCCSPIGACPIPAADWRSNAHSTLSQSERKGPVSSLDDGQDDSSDDEGGSSRRFTGSFPSAPASGILGHAKLRPYGLREQLLRAASIPHQEGAPAGGSAAPRRRSMSSMSAAGSTDEWGSPGADAEGPSRSPWGEASEQEDCCWSPEGQSECLNWAEVEELCGSMDIAGMKVEDVEITWVPPGAASEWGMRETPGVELSLLSIKFEGMTLRHYPGDHLVKQLFHSVISS